MKERYRTVAEGSSAIELREREKGFAGQSKAGERRTQNAESRKQKERRERQECTRRLNSRTRVLQGAVRNPN